jgi:hypothetical protein
MRKIEGEFADANTRNKADQIHPKAEAYVQLSWSPQYPARDGHAPKIDFENPDILVKADAVVAFTQYSLLGRFNRINKEANFRRVNARHHCKAIRLQALHNMRERSLDGA